MGDLLLTGETVSVGVTADAWPTEIAVDAEELPYESSAAKEAMIS